MALSFKELVVGGFQHVFDADGRMIFKPMDHLLSRLFASC